MKNEVLYLLLTIMLTTKPYSWHQLLRVTNTV